MTKVASLAFIFPGQGSQSVSMLSELASKHSVVTDVFAEASENLDYDLWKLVQDGPSEALQQTDKTQPAMLAAGIACWRVWTQQTEIRPALMAGHSLGEYTALVCAEALDFAAAIKLVAQRGRFMQQAVPEGQGGMAAILGLDDDQVRALCEEAAQGEIISAVNFNSPGQVVIAGTATAIARAVDNAKDAGAKRALLLPVSVPSHCELMLPAAENMRQLLNDIEFKTPLIPVINNVDVAQADSADSIRDALVRQLHNPVRWVETIQDMVAANINYSVEAGPGKVLSGLNKRIDRSITALPVFDSASLDKAITAINEHL